MTKPIRGKALIASKLDEIPGVGPTKRRDLLRSFGSVEALTAATETELQRVGGIGPHTAAQIRTALAAAVSARVDTLQERVSESIEHHAE